MNHPAVAILLIPYNFIFVHSDALHSIHRKILFNSMRISYSQYSEQKTSPIRWAGNMEKLNPNINGDVVITGHLFLIHSEGEPQLRQDVQQSIMFPRHEVRIRDIRLVEIPTADVFEKCGISFAEIFLLPLIKMSQINRLCFAIFNKFYFPGSFFGCPDKFHGNFCHYYYLLEVATRNYKV